MTTPQQGAVAAPVAGRNPGDLTALPSTSLALALGFQCARPVAVGEAGRVVALVEELNRRGEYAAMLAAMDPDLARAISLFYSADRAQVWRSSGVRPPVSDKSG